MKSNYYDSLPDYSKYDDPQDVRGEHFRPSQPAPRQLGKAGLKKIQAFNDEHSDSYVNDLIDSAQSGFYDTIGDLATGTRQLLTDNQTPNRFERSMRKAAERNREEIDPQRLAEMQQWGFGEDDDITLANTGMQLANVAGSFIPSMVPGGAMGKALQLGTKALNLGSKAQKVATATGYAASGAPLIGGSAANEVSETLRNMSPEQLSRLDGYEQYDSPEAFIYAQEQAAAKQGAGIGAVSMGIAGPVMQRLTLGAGTSGPLARAVTGAGIEGTQEAFEEGGQARVVNPLVGRDNWQDVSERAAEGFVLGGGAGGIAGGTGAVVNKLLPDSGPLARAVNAGTIENNLRNPSQPASSEQLNPVAQHPVYQDARYQGLIPEQGQQWQRYDSAIEPFGMNNTITTMENDPGWHQTETGAWTNGSVVLPMNPYQETNPDSLPEPQPEPAPIPKVEVSPQSQAFTDNLFQKNKEVDHILKARGLDNPINQIIASKVEAMQQDDLDLEEQHGLLTEMVDSFNAGILAQENNEVSQARYSNDAYYQAGASLIGKDNVARSDAQTTNLESADIPQMPATPDFSRYDTAPISFPDNPQDKVRVEQMPRSHFNSPIKQVNSNHDAAQLVQAAIGNDATESMLAVVTSESGEVLNVIRHTEGLKASSTVAPGDLVSSIVNTPGAKTVRWAHSHPSGKTSSSNADEQITEKLNKLLEGTGITPAGHVIVVPHQDKYYDLDSGQEETMVPFKGEPEFPMALTKRVIVRRDMDNALTVNSPATGRMAAAQIPGKNGLALMDTRHQVIGSLPLTEAEMLTLKHGEKPALNEIFKAIDRTNTSAIIIKADNDDAAANVARFLNAHGDVRVLDYINQDGQSNAEGDERIIKASGQYYQKAAPETKGQTVDQLQSEVGNVNNVTIIPSHPDPTVSAYYDKTTEQITLVADKIPAGQGKQAILHELVHAHLKDSEIYQDAVKALHELSHTRNYKKAWQKVTDAHTPEHRRDEELLAYYLENHKSSGVIRRFINKVKQWLRVNFGLTKVTLEQVHDELLRYFESQRNPEPNPPDGGKQQVNNPQSLYAVNDRLNESINSGSKITDFLRNTKENWRPQWLGLLTLRQLSDIGKQYLPQLQEYVDLNTQMQTDRNAASEEYNQQAESWRKWAARNKAESEQLSRLMHDSTIAGIDPDNDGSDKGLSRRWEQLSPNAKKLYRDVRDSYILQNQRMAAALEQRIETSELENKQKEVLKLEVRKQFEQGKDAGVYFPLSRFGSFWLAGKDKTGEKHFSMYENHADLIRAEKELKKQGYIGMTTGRQIDKARLGDADEGLMNDLVTTLENNGIDKNSPLMDDVYQVFLRTLPSVSMRKSFIHRQGTQGFSPDALRSYASHSTHNASQTARLKYSGQLKNILEDAKKTSNDPRSDALVNEMQLRHQWVMNPTNSRLAQKASAIGFSWFLGLNPASALVNLTQNGLVTMPVLAARHGAVKSFTKMNAVLGEFIKAKGDFNQSLTGQRASAFRQMQASGAIDLSQAHNLAGLSETDSLNEYSPRLHKAMKGISYLFHQAEVLNRSVSGMAAYDLARDSGMSHSDAVRYGEEVIWESHFDYSNSNRARAMQGDVAKVLLMFKQYSQNVTYYLMRNFYQTFKGESPAVRKKARKKLTGTLGVSALMSGAMGLPLASTIAATANATASAFGDDDEPYDFNTELRSFLTDYLGKKGAAYVLDGAVNQLSGAAVSDRVKLNDLWLRAPNRDMEGRDSYHYLLEQIAGPMGSIPLNAFRGMQMVNEGHLQRGIEAMLPVALKNAAKAVRYAGEDVNTLRGDTISETNAYDEIIQAMGFTPAKVSEQYRINNSLKNYEKHILNRRKLLLASYAMAHRNRDGKAKQKVIQKMKRFSRKYPRIKISAQTLRRSMKARQRYSRQSQHGINLNRNIQPYLDKYAQYD